MANRERISNYFDIYAKKYLGERQGDSDKVFPALPRDASSKFNLKECIRVGFKSRNTKTDYFPLC